MKEYTNMRIEEWCGYKIRFVEVEGEWWAVLHDICKALKLKSYHVANRLDSDMLEKVIINVSDTVSNEVTSRARHTQTMLVVSEFGIYEALFASRRLEARKFRRWTATVMKKLRSYVGLQGYEALRLTDEEIQMQIDNILDVLYYDDETKELMVSIVLPGGDAGQQKFQDFIDKKPYVD